jgi:hypothetical protein
LIATVILFDLCLLIFVFRLRFHHVYLVHVGVKQQGVGDLAYKLPLILDGIQDDLQEALSDHEDQGVLHRGGGLVAHAGHGVRVGVEGYGTEVWLRSS